MFFPDPALTVSSLSAALKHVLSLTSYHYN